MTHEHEPFDEQDEAPETRVFSTEIPPAVQRVLDEESQRRSHVVIALSGSHAYGFPSPDSDYDLKAVHVATSNELLGLLEPRLVFDRLEKIQGVEIDYTSNEIHPVLVGLLKGNGNYFERFLGPIMLRTSPELFEIQTLVKRTLSRRVFHHYRGFASGQKKELEKPEGRTSKKLLYVLRTALTGTHLLKTGEMLVDLSRLAEAHDVPGVKSLIEAKRAGERTLLSDTDLARWSTVVDGVMTNLEQAHATSVLPAEPSTQAELESWLIALRKRSFNES
ncbi:MAG: nucleotidyltransferase domain-containing protein [Polyangiaceae bacterium]